MEHDEQKAFFEWAAHQRFPGIELLHATPNGGGRSKAEAGRLKAEGVKSGQPDVSWPVARGGFIGLAIEFKYADGTPSKEQRQRIDALQREGWCVAVCWSWTAAARMLKGYAGLLSMEPIRLEVPRPENPGAVPYHRNDIDEWTYDQRKQVLRVTFSDGREVGVEVGPMTSREYGLNAAVVKANETRGGR